MSNLADVPEQIRFPVAEEDIQKYWEQINAFHTSLKKSEGRKPFTFYDGPPFATGLPHYGHILAGTIKDIVTRYAHQTGHYVERRFGWDCHGLPIEFEIEKEIGLKTRQDVLKFGIDNYNRECRKIVMRFSEEWRTIVSRMGRWIDFDNDYKTMNVSFMESVWWVFKQLFEKGLVYRGFKVMPYSTGCTTPLSNFEANMNYKDVSDPEVFVAFPLADDSTTSLIAWTTTPWTLPSNLCLCVNPDLDYVTVEDVASQKKYILAESRLPAIYKKATNAYKILSKCKGKDLKGTKYVPMFPYFAKEEANGAFHVQVDSYVTSDSGTGVVHCAPGFGVDDYRVCADAGIIKKGEDIVCPIDADGNFTSEVSDFAGRYVKECDKDIIKKIKDAGRLISSGSIVHSYPFCWRSETPLLYRAIPGWFVAVEKIKDKLLKNNSETYWVPDFVKEKRFHNWLSDAKDWSISRNRYWGTPIPLWVSDDGQEVVCVGSKQELEELIGTTVDDLHREFIDNLTIPSRRGPEFGVLKRIEAVFDCWFESGSMPYAAQHYPFENKDKFESSFPADFIAEGLDQTRGWFYTLLVLGTALFDKAPFKNLIVNGLVLAEDGKKMSKRLKNYPDPVDVVNKHGADALRLYLINSPVVRAEPLKFKEDGVKEIVKDVFLPWFNAYRFFVQNMKKFLKDGGKKFDSHEAQNMERTNVMDQWIISASQTLIKSVKQEMEAYRLYAVVPKLLTMIDQLTNWFVRMNRKRLKGGDQDDWRVALATLYTVLMTLCRTMAPFTPFLTETIYQNLKNLVPESEREDSIHYVMIPEVQENLISTQIESSISNMQAIIEFGRAIRDKNKISLKVPLKTCIVISRNPDVLSNVSSLQQYITEELNVRNVEVTANEGAFVTFRVEPDNKLLGQRFGRDFKAIAPQIKALKHEQIVELRDNGKLNVAGHDITLSEVKIINEFKADAVGQYDAFSNDKILVLLDIVLHEDLKDEGTAREIVNRVQKLRKKAGLQVTDEVSVFYELEEGSPLQKIVDTQGHFINKNLKVTLQPLSQKPSHAVDIITDKEEVNGANITICVTRAVQ